MASRNGDVIAVTATPKSIGSLNVFIIWYLPGPPEHISSHLVVRHDSDWQQALIETKEFLRDHVRPAQVVGFTCFEEDHPNPTKRIFAVTYYKGHPAESITIPAEVKLPLYESNIIQGDEGWDALFQKVGNEIERNGTKETNFFVATMNLSENDRQQAVLLHWQKSKEDAMVDVEPRGGCGCTLF